VQVLTKQAHPYIPNSVPEIKHEMMQALEISSIEELYEDVPAAIRLKKELHLPEEALSEQKLSKHIESGLLKNKSSNDIVSFLGAGCWPHYVPAAVKEIVARSEFLTSYTPYQPEISQGMLQALFEYQSMICELTAMEAANCSMYDWATALGEAGRMASRITGRNEILIPHLVHPDRAATMRIYCEPANIAIKSVDYHRETGLINIENLKDQISEKTAAVYIESPSYLGMIETQVDEIAEEAHKRGALFIAGIDPISLGLLRPPGEYGADIVVGEAQPLGNPMNFGGPLLGIMACHNDLKMIRQMPGRIIGSTTTVDGLRQGFCMAMQTREQHIRREKATSNVCTNEALCAVASVVYVALLGPEGLCELDRTIASRVNYTLKELSKVNGVKAPVFGSSHFQEFTISFDAAGMKVKDVNKELLKRGIQGGKDLSKEFPELGETELCCVTEVHSKEHIDAFVKALNDIV
jgi:glycine dehydrogenase subunit 1